MNGTGDRRLRSAQRYSEADADQVHLGAGLELLVRLGTFTRASIAILDASGSHGILARAGEDAIAVDGADESSLIAEVIRTGRAMSSATKTHLGVPLIGRESLVVGALCGATPPGTDETAARHELNSYALVVQDQLDLIRRLGPPRPRPEFTTEELSAAIGAGQIVPWYQPIIEVGTGRTVGYEALARWLHPSGEVLIPARFVQLAEDSDLIIDLDHVVITQALADLRRWQRSDPDLRMSVNLSGRHFDFDSSVATILALVEGAGISPRSVDLELTETVRLRPGAAVGVLTRELRQLGFRVWLDDFGTGWSSLENLVELAVDGLKIDRAFVAVLDHQIGTTLTRAIVTVATELGLAIAIEGIETQDQADQARAMRCDFAQGFFWSSAVPASAIQPE